MIRRDHADQFRHHRRHAIPIPQDRVRSALFVGAVLFAALIGLYGVLP